jgi:hypothetical protein
VNIHYQPGIALPALSVLLLWIANRFIRKDEELVKSLWQRSQNPVH